MLDQLIRRSDDILKGVTKNSYVLEVFLEIEKSFDMVWSKGVLYKRDQLGCGGRMFNWVQGFLKCHILSRCVLVQ